MTQQIKDMFPAHEIVRSFNPRTNNEELLIEEFNQLLAICNEMASVLTMLSKQQIATWYPKAGNVTGGYYAGWDDAEYAVKQALAKYNHMKGESNA